MARENKQVKDERSPELKNDLEARLDELGTDPAQVGTNSAGQSGSSQGISSEAEVTEDSVEDLADTDQGTEAAAVEGVENAAEHPGTPDSYARRIWLPGRRTAKKGPGCSCEEAMNSSLEFIRLMRSCSE